MLRALLVWQVLREIGNQQIRTPAVVCIHLTSTLSVGFGVHVGGWGGVVK